MRLIHTADWHLGQSLHDHPRAFEHHRFLAWLLDRVEDTHADALIVAGDIFDVVSPSSEAQEQYYGFLAACRQRFENLDVVVVGGNHDSAARLDAPRSLLGALNIRVVGGLPLRGDGSVDADRALVPVTGADGEVAAYVLAVPFLRRRELPAAAPDLDPAAERHRTQAVGVDAAHRRLIEGYRALYRALADAGGSLRRPHQALVATGHLYMTDGRISERSERKIQVGNQHALPVDIFPDELAYVALGHLHRAQAVGGREHVRYAGSPIPLSLAEHGYAHQVVLVEFDGPRFAGARPLFVPRSVEILRVPEEHRPLDEVRARLAALRREPPPGAEDAERPLLEVRVLLDHAEPRLRAEIADILEGAWVRLLRIDVQHRQENAGPPMPRRDLDQIQPVEVFRSVHERLRGSPPTPELLDLFQRLLEADP